MRDSNVLAEDYYIWLLDSIESSLYPTKDYSKLLEKLYRTPFRDAIANDQNRVSDGLDLRNKFADEVGEHLYFIVDNLPEYCTILEMMIALAMRMEKDIMHDEDYGDRTPIWFWDMVDNLGLTRMKNSTYSERIVNVVLTRFNNREYSKDGKGGLFYCNDPDVDMRKLEIWYQMNYYLDEFL